MANDARSATTDCHALVNAGQTDKAIECYRGVLKKSANDLDARNGLAAALAKQKKYQSALSEFDEVLKRQPADGVALNGKAMMLIALNKIDEGFAVMQKAIETNPDNIQALHNLALFNLNHDHPEVAIPLWQRVLTIAPDDPDALVGLGEILMRQGKLDDALGYFNKVIEKDDRHARAIYLAGKTIAQHRPLDAIPYYERAALLADEAEPWYDLGLVRMFAREWRLAGQAFTQALKFAPDDYRIYLELGKVHLEMRRFDDAISHFEEVLKLNPPPQAKVTVRYHMGLVREAQGNKKKAADEYLQTLKADPNHLGATLNLAALYLEDKRFDAAKPLLDKALEIAPTNAIARFNLGKLLLAQGKAEAGKKELKALVAALPESDPLRQEAEEILAGRRK
jgi:tetratricopeptide (TPR) repeat protein